MAEGKSPPPQRPAQQTPNTPSEKPTAATSKSTSSPPQETSSTPPQPPPPPLLKHTQDLNYMHRPPRIVPNYGKKPRGTLPKSNVSRVLLYDNVTQQQMLHVKMTHLRHEQRKTGRLMDMHRKSFIVRRLQKQKHVADTILHVDHTLPLLTITNSTNGTGKARGEGHGVKGEGGQIASHREQGAHTPRHQLTTKSTAERFGDEPLPSLTQERYGASTSYGFALHPSTAPKIGNQRAATSMEHGTLPDIHTTSGNPSRTGKMVVHVDSQPSGLTRIMHTFQQQASWEGGANVGKGRRRKTWEGGRTTEDDRYRKLEKMLVRIEPPNEGYLELSPSFHSPRQTTTFTRPSSFHSSVYRRSSILSPAPIIINL